MEWHLNVCRMDWRLLIVRTPAPYVIIGVSSTVSAGITLGMSGNLNDVGELRNGFKFLTVRFCLRSPKAAEFPVAATAPDRAICQ